MNILVMAAVISVAATAYAGPYSMGTNDPTNPYDAPIPGFVGPNGDGSAQAPNVVNPEFISWATDYVNYLPAPGVASGFDVPSYAFGPVTGNHADTVSLGDLPGPGTPGEITMTFDLAIRNGVGADFAVFENTFMVTEGNFFAELAYVEVSTDGVNFAGFECDSLTSGPVGTFGQIDPTDVYNLAGKHSNIYTQSWGTPFDLEQLTGHALVTAGLVDLNSINYVRLIDVPGSGDFVDSQGDPIYDPWETVNSGGFDLEALGVLNETPNFDGLGGVDAADIDMMRMAIAAASDELRYDLDNDGDVDNDDLVYLIVNCVETTLGVGTARGDLNLDGYVDGTDLAIFKAGFGQVGVGYALGNINSDAFVDGTDLAIFKANFGYGPPTGPMPEPTVMCLLAAGAGLAVRRRLRVS
jgi:hypothetical protein